VEDTPDDLVFELHSDRLWGGHPYGRSILGSAESVAAMGHEQLRALHGGRYVGANLVVAGAGNVDHDDFVGRVETLFGATPRGEPAPSVSRPGATGTGAVHVARESAQTHLVFGSTGPRHDSDDRHATVLLSSALGGGMSSRLFQSVREELGLCYSIFSFQSFYREAGLTGVYVGTRPATADKAAEAVRAELAKVAREGIEADELARTKQQVKGQIMISLESTSSRLYRLASFALYEEPFLGLDDFLAKIDAVTQDDILRVARAYFDPQQHLELRLGPA
jgi:predicted Zn-dependent peptidase